MRILLLIGIFLSLHLILFSQTKVITGRVTDTDMQPILDVKIYALSDSNLVTFSDIGGFYSLLVVDTVTQLYFSKPGFQSKLIRIENSAEINAVLDVSTVYEMSFEDLLQTKVSTVSLKEQNINEAPGIVSILTRADLKQMGVRTVREALTYVAGFAPLQNDDEQILAVRGIFATTNQKILVMRDGHSLNEANLDIPQTDYSLSIENIEKIEIIRGPGASIYGNSALAAVVNIITVDDNQVRIKAGFGNYGQFNIDGYSGIKISNTKKLITFGRYSSVEGQPYGVFLNNYPNAPGYKGTYRTFNYPGNYDIGFNYRTPMYTSSLSVRKHVYKTYWTANGTTTNIDSLLVKPRLLQNSLHYDLTFKPEVNRKVKLNLQNYADYTQLNNYRLLGSIDSVKYLYGRMQLNEWNVYKLGLNYYGSWAISDKSQATAGLSFEQRGYLESWLADNTTDSSQISFKKKPFIPSGTEYRAACFVQGQFTISAWIKADAGLRFDYAQNFKSSLNPRMALIAYPLNNLIVKAIYTRAFQAPGYSYRTSNADFSGSISELQPERLTTYQASVRYEYKKTAFVEIAAYYNKLSNLITRIDNNYYANFGKVANYGLEAETRVNGSFYSIFANYSFLLPDTLQTDSIFKIRNIRNNKYMHFPQHSFNAGVNFRIHKIAEWSVFTQYSSAFYSLHQIKVDRRILFNSTLNIPLLIEKAEFTFSIYNILNTQYKLGDPSVLPMVQPGRWFMFSVTIKLNNNL